MCSSFDPMTMLDVIEHLSDAVEDMRTDLRLLKPNGMMLVITPIVKGLTIWALSLKRGIFSLLCCLIDDMPWHPRGLTPSTIVRELEQVFPTADGETSVVDDGSADHTLNILCRFMPCMRVLGKIA
jgi:hypothetical protein